jgi:hypothetical protein
VKLRLYRAYPAAILEMVIWQVPEPVEGSVHRYKRYKHRLFYGRSGRRIVGYDNERSKGDDRHVGGCSCSA